MADRIKWPRPSKRDILRALQCCYYVFKLNVVEDLEFDALQREWQDRTGKRLPIGSDRKQDYTEPVYALALYFAFRDHFQQIDEDPKPIGEVDPPRQTLYTKKSSPTTKPKREQQTGFKYST